MGNNALCRWVTKFFGELFALATSAASRSTPKDPGCFQAAFQRFLEAAFSNYNSATMLPGVPEVPGEFFSDEVLQKAKTARMYIEHLYRSQSQNFRERQDR